MNLMAQQEEHQQHQTLVPIICPSMLSCDFASLANESHAMIEAGADWLHMDVMDGHFVPNITIGAPVVKCLRKHTDVFLDCHLMVSHPLKWVNSFLQAGADQFTFHVEATGIEKAPALIHRIHETGMKVGIAIKPTTELDEDIFALIDDNFDKLNLVLIMTVEPGFGGQKLIPECLSKVSVLRSKYPTLNIQVDGGVTAENINLSSKAGANVIVSGSGVFSSRNYSETIAYLRDSVQSAIDDDKTTAATAADGGSSANRL